MILLFVLTGGHVSAFDNIDSSSYMKNHVQKQKSTKHVFNPQLIMKSVNQRRGYNEQLPFINSVPTDEEIISTSAPVNREKDNTIVIMDEKTGKLTEIKAYRGKENDGLKTTEKPKNLCKRNRVYCRSIPGCSSEGYEKRCPYGVSCDKCYCVCIECIYQHSSCEEGQVDR